MADNPFTFPPRAFASVTIIAALLVVSCGASVSEPDDLPYYDSPEFTPHWLVAGSPGLDGFHQVPGFQLTNQQGEKVSEQTVSNKIYVANFFFSTCPGICPTIRSKLAKVQKIYGEDPNFLILSHSIRPTNDTPAVLKAYAKQNNVEGDSWHLLTGDKNTIYDLAKSAYFANEDLGNIQDLDDFLHTENLLLIDQQRRIRGIYNGLSNSSVKNLIVDIGILKTQAATEP